MGSRSSSARCYECSCFVCVVSASKSIHCNRLHWSDRTRSVYADVATHMEKPSNCVLKNARCGTNNSPPPEQTNAPASTHTQSHRVCLFYSEGGGECGRADIRMCLSILGKCSQQVVPLFVHAHAQSPVFILIRLSVSNG